MAGSASHMLAQPRAMLVLRKVQLFTAIAVMGLAAYGITFLSFDGIDLMMFTAIATIIITVYIIVAELFAPVIYNYWAFLGLDIFAIIFWLVSFAYLASEVAEYQIVTYDDTCSYYYYGYCVKKRGLGLSKRATTNVYTYRNSMAAASGLGGLEFLLFTITLIFTSIHLHRHRKAGGHCMPGSSAPTSTAMNVEAGHGYGAPSIATTAVEPKETEMEGTGTHVSQSTYAPSQPMQAAQPMGVAGQGQGFGGQPAYA
ncbi:hypothetical protein EG329_006914 [Mollisiaceae sp. DMI_Dod_QoI]|nr:hypothetical protein EG329_006914 [Helotiales sp. DMI_Dod_QoI]